MSDSKVTVVPHLCCRNATAAYEFYQKALGATPMRIIKTPDGTVMHASLDFSGNPIYLNEEFPDHGALSPLSIGGTPMTLHVQVEDCDARFKRAVDAGCTAVMPPEDMFWGDRYSLVADPFGHKWAFATTIRQVSPEELDRAVAGFAATGS